MADYQRNGSRETEQKKGGRLLLTDYYDLAVLVAGIGIFAAGAYMQAGLEMMLALLLGYSLLAWLGRRRLKIWQERRQAYLLRYEKGLEDFCDRWEQADAAKIGQEAERVLQMSGMMQADGRFWRQGQWYELKVVINEQQLQAILAEKAPQIVIVPRIDQKLKAKCRSRAAGKMILGDWQDIFALAVKGELIDLPKEEISPKRREAVLSPGMLLFYGLLLLGMANVSRFFYVYFAGGIVLLSFYAVLEGKKSADNEIVLLKKAMNLTKSRL